MLVSVSPACVFPLLPLSFCFRFLPLLLTLLVAPVIEMEGTKTMMKSWFFLVYLFPGLSSLSNGFLFFVFSPLVLLLVRPLFPRFFPVFFPMVWSV